MRTCNPSPPARAIGSRFRFPAGRLVPTKAASVTATHALTVDLEEWFHGIELPQEKWPETSRLRYGLDILMRLLDEHGAKATFFVLGAVAERFPEIVKELGEQGHEIGCHGYAHQFVYKQTRQEFTDDLRRARDAIAAVGVEPQGYRAPYFSITKSALWALDVIRELGFRYDSSVFPVRNYRYGIPDASPEPYEVSTPAGPLWEIPLTPLRLGSFSLPFSGGAYLRILPWAVQRAAWSIATRRHITAVAYLHPWELDPAHPRIDLPRRIELTHYARLRLTEPRLRRLLRRYRFRRLDELFLT